MAKSTFSGPVVSNNGFIQAGANNIVELTANTTLTFNDHAGRIMEINDADGVMTLPSIKSGELGAKYTFFIGTNMTGKIQTDGTDKYVGSIMVAVDDGAKKSFLPGATNDVIDMNNGCICCTVRGDLIRILGNIIQRDEHLDGIFIETTGLADPGPVIKAFSLTRMLPNG